MTASRRTQPCAPLYVVLLVALTLIGAQPSRAQGRLLVGTWAAAGQCRQSVTVFTPEGHLFHMQADRTRADGAEIWDVVKGVYDVAATQGRPPFRFAASDNGAMEGYEIEVASLTATSAVGAVVFPGMASDPDERTPFRWTRCAASLDDAWPY